MEQNHPSTAPTKYRLAPAFLALLGIILVYLPASRYGAGLSPDSIVYIAVARNLTTGAGFASYDGSPFVAQPPLYPMLLAFAGGLFRTDPLALASLVNALIFGFTVYASGVLAFKYLPSSPSFAILGTAAILVSFTMFGVSTMAWSEPLFILFVLFSLLFANDYLQKKDTASLTLLSSSAALAALTRYIGVVLIPWGALIILMSRNGGTKKRLAHLSLFTLPSTLLFGLWLIRNYIVAGALFGERVPSTRQLSQNVTLAVSGLANWYIPNAVANRSLVLMLSALAVLVIAIMPFVVRDSKGSLKNFKVQWAQIGPITLFIFIYAAALVISSTTTAYDRIDDRLLSPVYIPLTLLTLILIQTMAGLYRMRFNTKIASFAAAVFIAIWAFGYSLPNTINNAFALFRNGQGYNDRTWLNSQTIQYLIQHPTLGSECAIYTNAPDVVYLLANMKANSIPARAGRAYGIEKSAFNAKDWVTDAETCLVWFDTIDRKFMLSLEGLQAAANINLIVRLEDGAIYSVTKK